jgi:hypothetical protein
MAPKMILLTGKLPKLAAEDLKRLSVYITRGTEVLAEARPQADGTVQVNLVRSVTAQESRYGLEVAIGPAGMANHLNDIPSIQRQAISAKEIEKAEREHKLPALEKIDLTKAVLEVWWRWCEWYCVNGTLIGPGGCPVPGAEVTVYSVVWDGTGYTKYPRQTVSTDINGQFTACFLWCRCPFCFPCWPCWPTWWECWPWWWEWDILHVLDTIAQVPRFPRDPGGPVESRIALIRPDSKQLIRGQGFLAARKPGFEFAPDPSRTQAIKRRLSDATIRSIFPWWWWCCDDPNIVFGATQAGNVILDENPATDTRWCLEDGSNVTLAANSLAITSCSPLPLPESGYIWMRVGDSAYVPDIAADGYYNNPGGGDSVDLAFAGNLKILGGFAPGSNVSYYQVITTQWTGDPARAAATPTGATSLLGAVLTVPAFIWRASPAPGHLEVVWIKMGPFTHGALTNLYSLPDARATAPTGTGLDPLPTVNPGDIFFGYSDPRVMVWTDAPNLIGGASVGTVNLEVAGYDAAFAAVALAPDPPLTLTIDNTGLTHANIVSGSLQAFLADGVTPAPLISGGDCPAYNLGVGGFLQWTVNVADTNGHICEYDMEADFGHALIGVTQPGLRGYSQGAAAFSAATLVGSTVLPPDQAHKAFYGGLDVYRYYPTEDCCYDLRLDVSKRVTNGTWFPTLYTADFQTVSVKI